MNYEFGLLSKCEEYEASILCNIMLFDSMKRKEEDQFTLLMNTLNSIVAEGKGEYTVELIQKKLEKSFHSVWDEKWNRAYNKLLTEGVVRKDKQTGCLFVSETDKTDVFFRKLDERTNLLIEGIFKKYMANNPTRKDPLVIKKYIRDVLSIHYKLSGLSFFGVQKKDFNQSLIWEVMSELDEFSRKCLALAIGETLSCPSKEDKDTLDVWAKAFVLSQMTNLDPTLIGYRQQQLRNKSFMLDTDFVLYVLTNNASYSAEYHAILNYLRGLNCEICIPKSVRDEVLGCINEAQTIVEDYGEEKLFQMGDVYKEYSKRNIFVEDYICTRRKDSIYRNLTFAQYLGNIYSEKTPVIFKQRIEKLIGKENSKLDWPLKEIENDLQEALKAMILRKTAESPKGQDRTDWFNDKTATFDTRIYLTLCSMNKDIEEEGSLPYRYYLLTRSTKTVNCAKELGIYDKNIICSPQAMTAILNALGDIKDDVNIVDLFENPFLAYVADNAWNLAEPLLANGYTLQYKDLACLKLECESDFHDLLNGETKEEIEIAVKKYDGKGYKFAQDLAMLSADRDRLQREKQLQAEEIEMLKKINAQLQKANKTALYKERFLKKTESIKKRVANKFRKK